MQAAAASTLVAGSVMLAIFVARGTLELLFWGCRLAQAQVRQPLAREISASPLDTTISRR